MAATSRIKVSRLALIEKIKARRDEAIRDYERKTADFERASKTYPADMAKFLSELAKSIRAGEVDPEALEPRWGRRFDNFPSRPSEPSMPRDYDAVIGQLEIGAEETLTITGDDYANYLK